MIRCEGPRAAVCFYALRKNCALNRMQESCTLVLVLTLKIYDVFLQGPYL